MQIAVCDDDKIFRHQIRQLLIAYKRQKHISIDIYEFSSGKELLNSDIVFDVVFMDYQMPYLDGLETSRRIRKNNAICSIIFVTSFPESCILDAFKVETFRFLVKPIKPEQLYEVIDDFIYQQKLLAPLIIIEDGELKTIQSKEIIYVEGDGKYSLIRTNTQVFHSSKTVTNVHSLLPQYCFCRVHKSYAVNMHFIDKINRNIIMLVNGEKVPIGRTYKSDFKQAYHDFIKNFFLRL